MANFLKSLFVKGVEIDTTGASTGNVLSYNGTKFAPATPGSGSLSLDDLSDVVVTSPEEFQGISYNGTSWVNSHIPLVSYVRNAESTTITTGTCVYLYGSTGDHATVKRADNTSDTTSSKTIGVVGANITASNNGPVITRGYVDGIDLSTGYTAGDVLWLGTNGAFTKTKPTAPDHLVFIGVVVRATNNGIIYVATQNGYELDEIHNVSLPNPQSGEFLKYNGSLWVADAIDLGTDTTGSYVASLVAGTGISLANNSGEGATPTITNTGVTSINTTLTGAVTGIVTTADTGTVTSAMIADGTIVNGDINASANIALSKLASGTSGQVVIANGSGVPTYTTISGDITISSAGVATIASNSVALGTDTTGSYVASLVAGTGISLANNSGEGATPTITNSGVTSINTTLTGNVTGVVTTSDTGTVTSTMIADGTIVNGDINASAGIALSKLASGTSGQVVIANGTGVPTYTTISGDITISSTGVATIAADSVALGTDTTGNYMSGVSAGTGISVTHTPGEGSTATIAVDTTYTGFVPTGTVVQYAGTVAPSGWLVCDGSAVSRTTYSALWTALGTTSSVWGQGNGSTTFNLPNMVSRLPYGGNTGATSTTITLSANTDHGHNATAGNQSANHSHTITSNSGNQSAAHNHSISSSAGNVNADHTHNWGNNTGYVSNGHTHNYTDYYGNSGGAGTKTTNDINQNHYHYVSGTTSGISTNHQHAITSNAGNESANHSHTVTSNAGNQSADHNHTITVASTTSMTHSHTLTTTQFIYIIKV